MVAPGLMGLESKTDASLEEAKVMLSKREYDGVIGKLTAMLADQVKSTGLYVMMLMVRARAYQLKDMHHNAIQDYSEALQCHFKKEGGSGLDNSAVARIYVLRASSYVSIRRADLAMLSYNAAEKLCPDEPSIFTGRANMYILMENYDAALQSAEAALQCDPDYFLAQQHLGMVYTQINRIDDAICAFGKLLDSMAHYETYILRGKAFATKRMVDDAMEDFQSAIDIDPRKPAGYGNLAALFAQIGDLPSAIEEATNWVEHCQGKELAAALQARGVWLAENGDFDEAIADFTRVIGLDEAHVSAFSSRATAYSHQGKHDEAIADWNRVIDLHPEWPKAFWSMGEEYVTKEEYEIALYHFSEAIRLEPRNPATYKQRAHAHVALEQYTEAATDLTTAVRLDPKNKQLYEARFSVLLKKGDYKHAMNDLNSIIHLDSENPIHFERRAALFWKIDEAEYGRTDLLHSMRLRRDQKLAAQSEQSKLEAEGEEKESTDAEAESAPEAPDMKAVFEQIRSHSPRSQGME